MSNIVVSSGVTSTGLSITSGLTVLSGGTLVSSTLTGTVSVNGTILAGGTVSALLVGVVVFDSGTAIGTHVSGNNASFLERTGSIAQGTFVYAGGNEGVQAGAVSTGTIISAGGFQQVNGGAAFSASVQSGGVEKIFQGVASNTVVSNGGTEDLVGGSSVLATVLSGGFLYVSSGATAVAIDTTLSGGTEYLQVGTDSAGTIDAGGTLIVLNGNDTASSTLVNSGGVLVISAGGSAVSATVSAGGAIDMAFLPYSGATTATFNSGTNLLTVTEGGTSATLTLAGSYAGEAFTLTSGAAGGTLITVTPCFATGTRIATPDGATAIEALSVGDKVLNAEGEALAIKWLGHRQVNCAAHPSPEDVWPVRIRADAFAAGQPSRDLLVSPEHAILVDGFLMPARALINGATIAQELVDQVTYWHLELASHDVILAEGLPAESYLDTGNRGAFVNGGPSLQLHPRFGRQVHEALACAPFADAGPHVARARADLLSRAHLLGFAAEAGAWWVEADGVAVPQALDGAWLVPAGAAAVRLRAPSWRPMDIEPGNVDTRRLGLCLTALAINGVCVTLDDARLGEGFHPAETDGAGMWRWTYGDAVLPESLFAAGQGSRLVLAAGRAPLVWRISVAA